MLLRAPQSQSVMVVDDDSDDEDCVVTEVIPAASHPRSIAKEVKNFVHIYVVLWATIFKFFHAYSIE